MRDRFVVITRRRRRRRVERVGKTSGRGIPSGEGEERRGETIWTDERGRRRRRGSRVEKGRTKGGREERAREGRKGHRRQRRSGIQAATAAAAAAAEASPLLIITAWRASERAPVKHPSSRRMAPLPITSAVIANFSRSSLLLSALPIFSPLTFSLPLTHPPFRPCLVARLLDQPTRQLASTFARLGNFPLSLSLSLSLSLFLSFSLAVARSLALARSFFEDGRMIVMQKKNQTISIPSTFISYRREMMGEIWGEGVIFNCSPFRRAYGTSYLNIVTRTVRVTHGGLP